MGGSSSKPDCGKSDCVKCESTLNKVQEQYDLLSKVNTELKKVNTQLKESKQHSMEIQQLTINDLIRQKDDFKNKLDTCNQQFIAIKSIAHNKYLQYSDNISQEQMFHKKYLTYKKKYLKLKNKLV